MNLFDQELKNMTDSLKKDYVDAGNAIINQYKTGKTEKIEKTEKDSDILTLRHYIGKNSYNLYKLTHTKIRAWGVPIALILTYSSIVAATKYFLPNINPIYTCSMATIAYICGFIWATTTIQEYYSIQFRQYGLLKNYKKILYCGIDKDKKNNIIYKFKSNMTLSMLHANSEIIEMVLKTNVLDIKQNNNKRFFNIITNSKITDYKVIAKNDSSLCVKIHAAYKHLGFEIYNIKEKIEPFRQEILFDCKGTKKQIENLLPEIIHLTSIQDLKIVSNYKTDFKIILNKPMGIISFGDLLVNTTLNLSKNIIVGLSNNNNLITLDIKKIYHSIIAGSTGYGKSNLSHILISSMLKSNIDTAMFLFDPKKSELKRYRDINRVYYSGDKKEIINMLEKIVAEMDRRNELIEKNKFVNNLETYNKTYPVDKMGYIIVYIEEIADLMLSSDKSYSSKFVDLITRLGQVGRSTGIRMFLSTQYPKADILPTLIKSNCITRFGFAVSNSTESGVIMDCPILTELKKKGEMYLKNGEFTKLQVPLLEDKDIVSLITYLEQRHNKIGQYPLGDKIVSNMSNEDITDLEQCQKPITTKPTLVPIQNCEDLLNFYILNCENEVYSVNKTAKIVTLGRTKLQELRKELINNEDLKVVNGKTYISPKLKRIK